MFVDYFAVMKETFFHGTSFDNLPSILKYGLEPDAGNKVWEVSNEGVYIWSPTKLAEMQECDDDNAIEYAKNMAYQNAAMSMAKNKSGKCVVFELSIDKDNLSEDNSCNNMEGAFVSYSLIPSECIKSIWVSPDLSMIKGYFIYLAIHNHLYLNEFSELETKIGKIFQKACEKNFAFHFEIEDFPLELYIPTKS